jgi:hypothetical protein
MLPSWWRQKAGVRPSSELLAAVDDSGAHVLETRDQGLARARALVRKYVTPNRRLSEELVRERRRDAAREEKRR